MIEQIVRNHLAACLDVKVAMELPSDPPACLVVIHKGGSSRENGLEQAMIVADSYGPSLYEAARLNEQVKKALDALAELPSVSASRLQNDYPVTDTRNKRYRYQAVYDVTHYE